ncbi:MAG: protein kinase, partial [Acidobacteria bacterium]
DFGLAKCEPAEPAPEAVPFVTTQSVFRESAAVVGSLPYMSPEQVIGKAIDERSDIFSFGSLFYEMLTGTRPFCASTQTELIASILRDNPPLHKAALPVELCAIIHRCLQKEPNRRFQSADELSFALTQVLNHSNEVQQTSSDSSVAVLYFENLSRSHDNEYIRDGITEDVITELSRIKKLRVYSRSAVVPYRDKTLSAAEIARQLRVRYLVEGSIRRSRNRLRITARLVDAEQGHSIWSERYDRQVEDILELQDGLARNIAQALRITLSTQEESELAHKPTANPEAYDYYLRGRSHLRRKTHQDLEEAYRMFQRATFVEPDFALAYASLSFTCAVMYVWYDPEAIWHDRAIAFADQAGRIDAELPQTLVAQAMLLMGKKEYDRAIQLTRQAIAIDPHCDGPYWILGSSLFCCDRLIEVTNLAQEAIAAGGDDYNVYVPFVHAFEILGRGAELWDLENKWSRVLARQLESVPDDARARMLLATYHARHGKEKEAIHEAESAIWLRPRDKHILYNAACAFGVLKRNSESLNYLRQALESGGYPFMDWLLRDPDLANIRNEPEFQELVNLPRLNTA